MRLSRISLLASVTFAAVQFQGGGFSTAAYAQAGAALTGTVSSTDEGNMEGVLVSAKKEGSTITTTVVSDDKGNYSFPADRLSPGKYTISIRASGYTLVGPKTADVTEGAPAHAELKLGKPRNFASQL